MAALSYPKQIGKGLATRLSGAFVVAHALALQISINIPTDNKQGFLRLQLPYIPGNYRKLIRTLTVKLWKRMSLLESLDFLGCMSECISREQAAYCSTDDLRY